MSNTESNENDRRQSQRWNLKIPLRVFQANTEVIMGHLVDVSLHGMRMVSNRRLDFGSLINLELELPDGSGQLQRVTVTVNGVHCQPDPKSGGYFHGFQFIAVEPETIFNLQRLVHDLVPFS